MSEMKDYGLQYFNPDRVIIDPPVNKDWQTTKDGGGGTPRDEINSGLGRAKDVRALYDRGYTESDFDRLRQSSDPDEKAIGDSQQMFWGHHPVSVTKNGDDITCADGRHRLDAAQSRGETNLPMRVHAAADDPEFADKKFDAARRPERDTEPANMSERMHQTPETPELNNTQEKRPQLDEHPDLRAQREQSQQPADIASNQKESVDSSGADRGLGKDSMDGASEAKSKDGLRDSMDGAGDIPKKAGSEANDATDIRSRREPGL